ncbi:tetratricopeptide repeat protein [Arthrobacter sp. SX1312]|uniref:tetratricopeptide repeat protein n=1 Tax=Arthrobacter sp. SX1312 TaxID=2058896 RepID=UPI000CE39A57|nr:tetratricopeptide repeat protein [Arthrobacter sp. SX1312]
MTLDDELDLIVGRRDRDNMRPTIDALLPLHAAYPEDARVLYEVGGAYDTAGQEDLAQGFYEKALAAGLEGDLLRRCYLQYGSTLRNLGEYGTSLEVLGTARGLFPDSPALAVFEAISLQAAGGSNESVASLLDLVVAHLGASDIGRYEAAISGNAACIRSMEGAVEHLPRAVDTDEPLA